jgi:hypothetical protein
VIVTGVSSASANIEDFYAEDIATVAYDARTGATRWLRRYDGPASSSDGGTAIGVGPDGSAVFVSGVSGGNGTFEDYVTLAYRTG